MEFRFAYDNDVVIMGHGGVSETLVENVYDVLKKNFGFSRVVQNINRTVENFKPFLDSECKENQKREDVVAYKGKFVYILQYLKVFDTRLAKFSRKLRKYAEESGDDRLLSYADELDTYALPDLKNKIAPRFMSSAFNPASAEKQLVGQINAAKMGGARHIGVVIPKTIFEWSHHYAEKWREGRFEMPAWHDFLEHIAETGADSVIVLHPHAPKEGLETTDRNSLNYIMVYPPTYTLSSNGWIYSIEQLFSEFDVNEEFDPLLSKIHADKELLGELAEYANLLMFSSSVDHGSRDNALRAAQRFGLGYIRSAKHRTSEGESEQLSTEDLAKHLIKLKEYVNEATLRVYIMDDMMNSGGTANTEALERKRQVQEFNSTHGTNFTIEVELIVTHMRCPWLEILKHDHLDKIVFFDTLPYVPPLEEQLSEMGISHKVQIIKNTPHQMALGIAADYYLQKLHYQMELNPTLDEYREVSDKYLVKRTRLGKEIKSLRWYLEELEDSENHQLHD
jgi:phosphoribosylpyrophosphate synthetase